jgi:hypothetical protein
MFCTEGWHPNSMLIIYTTFSVTVSSAQWYPSAKTSGRLLAAGLSCPTYTTLASKRLRRCALSNRRLHPSRDHVPVECRACRVLFRWLSGKQDAGPAVIGHAPALWTESADFPMAYLSVDACPRDICIHDQDPGCSIELTDVQMKYFDLFG